MLDYTPVDVGCGKTETFDACWASKSRAEASTRFVQIKVNGDAATRRRVAPASASMLPTMEPIEVVSRMLVRNPVAGVKVGCAGGVVSDGNVPVNAKFPDVSAES